MHADLEVETWTSLLSVAKNAIAVSAFEMGAGRQDGPGASSSTTDGRNMYAYFV